MVIILMLPLLYFVYFMQGKVILPESQYSMNQWGLVQSFMLNDQFLFQGVFLFIVYDMVLKEKITGYNRMFLERGRRTLEVPFAKMVATIIYLSMIYSCIIAVTKLLYVAFSLYLKKYFSGILFYEDFNLEKGLFSLEFLYYIYNCVFMPSMVILTSHSFEVHAALIYPLFVIIVDRLFASLVALSSYSIWHYLKMAKTIVSRTYLGITWKPYLSMIGYIGFMTLISLWENRYPKKTEKRDPFEVF